MNTGVQVHAPCRLHFGMFSFGHSDRPQFGGIGVMVAPPGVEVSIEPARHFAVQGLLADRARQFVELLAVRWKLPPLPACEITIQSPRNHTGLGVGTQLSLATAAGMRRFLHLAEVPVEELATAVGRGTRSAVGTYGFQHGGLIVDAGKMPGDALGSLVSRMALPETWRFVLICRRGEAGLADTNEAVAFARLPPVPDEITRELWAITNEQMLPAVVRCDCRAFGEAVFRFGRLAGDCFSTVQGGPFAGDATARLVESIREFGAAGVGQSSWGPTVFAVTESDQDAQRLTDWLLSRVSGSEYEITIAHPNNSGVRIERHQGDGRRFARI
jgi:beta-ribofuranosylaminobenzene 5'-phosphate synthase